MAGNGPAVSWGIWSNAMDHIWCVNNDPELYLVLGINKG
jgi:hypothetical protein